MRLNYKKLPVIAALLGAALLLLRMGVYTEGIDAKGLLIAWHALDIACWAVTGLAVLALTGSVLMLKGSSRYEENFYPSIPAALGAFVLAAVIALTLPLGWQSWGLLDLLCRICGALSVPALVWVGVCRWRGKAPFFAAHGLVCLYLTLHAVSRYQFWCSQPQLQNYFFDLAATLSLTLFAYYQTAFDVGLGSRRKQLLAGLLSGFFCIGALMDHPLLYLGGGIWALTNLCRVLPPRRRRARAAGPEVPSEAA